MTAKLATQFTAQAYTSRVFDLHAIPWATYAESRERPRALGGARGTLIGSIKIDVFAIITRVFSDCGYARAPPFGAAVRIWPNEIGGAGHERESEIDKAASKVSMMVLRPGKNGGCSAGQFLLYKSGVRSR